MSRAWLIRLKPDLIERMEEFKTLNIIAIGFPQIPSLAGKNKNAIREEVEKVLSTSGYELSFNVAALDMFVNQMKPGDFVVVPYGNEVYIVKVSSDYYYDSTKVAEGYPHQRKAEWLKGPVPRTLLPERLKKSLHYPKATANLSAHVEEIKAIIEDRNVINEKNTKEDFIVVEYPLRPDVMVKISIPRNITQAEAQRLGEFVKTLFFE